MKIKEKFSGGYYSKWFAFGFSAIMMGIMGVSICKIGYHQGRIDMLDECNVALKNMLETRKEDNSE